MPHFAVRLRQYVADALFLTGQNHRHLVGSCSIGQRDRLKDCVLIIGEVVQQMHHGDGDCAVEELVLCLVLVELQGPESFEIDGIQQIAGSERIESLLIEDEWNHAHRVVAAPLVDGVHGLAIAKVACLGGRIIVVVGLLFKVGQQVAFVQEDGIRNHHLGLLVESRQLGMHLFAKVIDFIGISFAKA